MHWEIQPICDGGVGKSVSNQHARRAVADRNAPGKESRRMCPLLTQWQV